MRKTSTKIDPAKTTALGDYLAARTLRRGNDGFRGDVAGAEVFARNDRSTLWYADTSIEGDMGEHSEF